MDTILFFTINCWASQINQLSNMSLSEFRWNKKRRHYAYIFKECGDYKMNILLSTDPYFVTKKHGKTIIRKNIRIAIHPNPNLKGDKRTFYIVNHKPYFDRNVSFNDRAYSNWKWSHHDKRLIKRFKKYRKYRSYFDNQ